MPTQLLNPVITASCVTIGSFVVDPRRPSHKCFNPSFPGSLPQPLLTSSESNGTHSLLDCQHAFTTILSLERARSCVERRLKSVGNIYFVVGYWSMREPQPCEIGTETSVEYVYAIRYRNVHLRQLLNTELAEDAHEAEVVWKLKTEIGNASMVAAHLGADSDVDNLCECRRSSNL